MTGLQGHPWHTAEPGEESGPVEGERDAAIGRGGEASTDAGKGVGGDWRDGGGDEGGEAVAHGGWDRSESGPEGGVVCGGVGEGAKHEHADAGGRAEAGESAGEAPDLVLGRGEFGG